MPRFFIVAGIAMLVLGLASPYMERSGWWRWIGRLPGDLHIERDGFSFHFPIVSSIVLSIAVSVLVWLFRK